MNETPNIFTNCRVIGADTDPAAYHRQEPGVGRGDNGFVASRGELSMMAAGWARWRAGWNPEAAGKGVVWGSLSDCQRIMPQRFEDLYAVEPEKYTDTGMQCPNCGSVTDSKKCAKCKVERTPVTIEKDWNRGALICEEWKENQGDKTIISAEDLANSMEAEEACKRDVRISQLLSESDKQVFVIGEYRDGATGLVIPVKCLIDLVPRLGTAFQNSLADWKTARNAHPGVWPMVVHERWYDAQAAMELWLWNAATGEDRTDFFHAIQENVHPWQTGRRLMSAETIEVGRLKIRQTLENYCQCLAANVWPDWDQAAPYGPSGGWSLTEPTTRAMESTAMAPQFDFMPEPANEPETQSNDIAPSHVATGKLTQSDDINT